MSSKRHKKTETKATTVFDGHRKVCWNLPPAKVSFKKQKFYSSQQSLRDLYLKFYLSAKSVVQQNYFKTPWRKSIWTNPWQQNLKNGNNKLLWNKILGKGFTYRWIHGARCLVSARSLIAFPHYILQSGQWGQWADELTTALLPLVDWKHLSCNFCMCYFFH